MPTPSACRLVAVAAADPLDPRTFSGLSANLFRELQRQGIRIDAIASRDVRWHDVLRGALNWQGLLRRASRSSARINPDWFWSRRTNERMTRRFRARLDRLADVAHVLQIGTHVQAAGGRHRAFCLTDCTVVQAFETGGAYQIAQASPRVRTEAIDWQREIFDGCERIFVLSDWTARSVTGDYQQPREKVITVGAGANLPEELPPRAPDALAPAILFVGLDWEQKGGPLLYAAFRRVRARIPRARLVVVGCSPQELRGEPGVEVLGRLARSVPEEEARLLHAYATASCFCIAPRVDAFPNVLLEAGAFGIPVVSTDEGSRAEAVVDRVTGRLVRPNDPDALADALAELLADPALAARYGEAGSKRVRERFTWPIVARTIAGHMGLGSAHA
jgi:glycosyltransferase involved in cell wall biosynthesis